MPVFLTCRTYAILTLSNPCKSVLTCHQPYTDLHQSCQTSNQPCLILKYIFTSVLSVTERQNSALSTELRHIWVLINCSFNHSHKTLQISLAVRPLWNHIIIKQFSSFLGPMEVFYCLVLVQHQMPRDLAQKVCNLAFSVIALHLPYYYCL